MPDYDFVCDKCGKKFSLNIPYEEYGKQEVQCVFCKSKAVTRCVGRVRISCSDTGVLEEMGALADPQNMAKMQDNPRDLGGAMRRISEEIGEEVPPEFSEVVERLERGQSSSGIDESMPDD